MDERSPDGVKHRETVKFIPPDVTAQIFWLKNRRPEIWREKQQIEVGEDALERVKDILGSVESVIE